MTHRNHDSPAIQLIHCVAYMTTLRDPKPTPDGTKTPTPQGFRGRVPITFSGNFGLATVTACFDSITQVSGFRGRAVLAASHASIYSASMVLKLRLGGVILNDAGIGRERAGVAGLHL